MEQKRFPKLKWTFGAKPAASGLFCVSYSLTAANAKERDSRSPEDGPKGKSWGAAKADGTGANVLDAALGYAAYVAMVDKTKGDALRAKVLALRAKYR